MYLVDLWDMISGLAEFSDVTVFFQGAFKQTNKQGLI